MKRSPHFFAVAAIVCAVLVVNACKKDDTKTCCKTELPNPKWQLTTVQYDHHDGPGAHRITRHQFVYDKNGRLTLYQWINDLINPAHPVARQDTFYYDNQHRVSSIVSTSWGGIYSNKRTFTYNGSGQRVLCLKYLLDNANQYHLSDSTVYVYQDTTITKFVHHIAGGTDTILYVYNQQQNLVQCNFGSYYPGIETLSAYDDQVNAFKYTGLDALDLDPSYRGQWDEEFLVMAQMPRFSANNYQEEMNVSNHYYFSLGYSPVDSLLSTAYTPTDVYEYTIQYVYTPVGI